MTGPAFALRAFYSALFDGWRKFDDTHRAQNRVLLRLGMSGLTSPDDVSRAVFSSRQVSRFPATVSPNVSGCTKTLIVRDVIDSVVPGEGPNTLTFTKGNYDGHIIFFGKRECGPHLMVFEAAWRLNASNDR